MTPKPSCESPRLEALYRYAILDTASDSSFDDLARLASYICCTPIAVISFVDAERQWFKSAVGLDHKETPRDIAFCAHTILESDLLTVGKADEDERFRNHPWVIEPPALRFYAGVPLISPDGYAIGSLAVMDAAPRALSPEQQASLRTIANQVMAQLELRRAARSSVRHEWDRRKEIATEQKKTEEILRKSEHKFRSIFEQAPVGIATIDSLTGRFKSVNAAYCRIIGYSVKELLDRTFLDITHPDDLRPDLDQMKRLLDGTIPSFEMDKRLLRKNGRVLWVHLTCVSLWQQPSDPCLHLAIVQDITERKQAEKRAKHFQTELEQLVEARTEELQRTQHLLQNVIDSSPDWIFVKDREHRFVLVNKAFAASQQVTPADMAGKLDSEFWSQELCEGNPAKGIRGFHTDDRCAFAGELIHNPYDPASLHDGTIRIFDTYKGPWRNPDGQIGGVLCYARDVTEQRRAEETIRQMNSELAIQVDQRTEDLVRTNQLLENDIAARKLAEDQLHESHQFLSSILNHIPSAVFVKDARTLRYAKFNQACETLTGLSSEDVLGKTDPELFLSNVADFFVAKDRAALDSRTIVDIPEEIISTKNRGELVLHIKKVPVLDEVGHPLYLLGIAEDITSRKRVEEERSKQELLISLMLNTGPGCIKRVAADGTLLHMNPAGLTMIEACREGEVIGLSVFDLVLPEHRTAFINMHQDVINGNARTLQFEIQGLQGSRKWMETYAVPFHNPVTGNVEQLAVTHNITERKQAEQALQLTRFSIDHAMDAIFWVDESARILDVNDSACHLLGYSREELLSKTVHDIDSNFPSEAWPAHWAELKARRSFSFESTHFKKDGTTFPTEVTVNFLRHEGKEYNCAFMRDITDRKQAEANLRLTQTAVDRAADMAFWITPDAHFIYVNQAACNRLGYTGDELRSMTVADIDPDYQLDRWPRHWDELRQAGQLRFETRHRTKSGEIYPVEVVANFVPFGERAYNFAFTRDISRRKKAEAFAAGQRTVLELIATHAPLPDILTCLCLEIEKQDDDMLCSILILEGTKLRHGAGPSLPDEYNRAIDGIAIGPSVGSCGTAAHKNETVIVKDIALDPLWADDRDLALRHGLRACWSTPIHSAAGTVLGTFAIYHRIPSVPSPAQRELIALSVYLGGIAIERNRSEKALQSSEERFRLVAEATQDILWDWDLTADTRWWSQNGREKLGCDLNDMPGDQVWTSRLHPDDRGRIRSLVQDALASTLHMFSGEYRFRLKDGTYGYFIDRAYILRDGSGKPTRMIGAMIDVTSAKQAYASLQEAYCRLQAMANELQTVELNERRRLSRELHDEVGQLLTALKFDLESVKRAGVGKKQLPTTQVTERLTRALDTTDLLFSRLRQIVRALRPPVLEELGLKAALGSLATDAQARTGIACSVVIEGDDHQPGISPTRETAIYRIAQELLTNVIRHAQAKSVSISLALAPDHWILAVEDDGIGFDPTALQETVGVGLRGIRERVEILGGRVDVTSQCGQGTLAVVWTPVVADQTPRTARKRGGRTPSVRRRGRKQAHD